MPSETTDRLASKSRLAALERTGLVDSPREEDFDRVVFLVSQMLGVETALLSFVTADKQFFKSDCGLAPPLSDLRETPLSHSFCKHVVVSDAALIIEDASNDARVAGNLAISELGVAAYLGVPVHGPDGETLGSLCALSSKPRPWSKDEIKNLEAFTAIIETEIALREKVVEAEQLAAENAVLAREFHHRVKNAMAVSASLVSLSGRDSATVREVVTKATQRLNALAEAHDSVTITSDALDLRELAQRLLLPYFHESDTLDVGGPPVLLRQVQITPICLFIHELATNAAKYGAFHESGTVQLRWTVTQDNGVLLTWEERSPAIAATSEAGFGSMLLKIAAKQLAGEFGTQWEAGRLVATLNFPQTPPAS